MKKLLLLSVIIFITSNSFAQETSQMRVVGNGKLAEGEFVGSNVVDANQEICAGLIILSDLTGLSYTSYNGIVKIDRKPGRDLLFLSPTERVVEVYKEGYEPLKIILSEFNVFLKSKMVHELRVTGDKKVDFFPVVILTKPEGTEKIINGERKGSGTTFNLPEGKHTLRIEKSGYEPIEESINVNSNQLVFNFTLRISCEGSLSYEGKTYKIVQIGSQCWLKENLNVGTRINGSSNQTNNSKIEKYCYNDQESNCNTYGGLYQWDEAMHYSKTAGARGICPTGWHIPTYADLQALSSAVGNNSNALKAIGQGSLSGTGTNTSGFSALLAGLRKDSGNLFSNLGFYAYFWSSVENDTASSQYLLLNVDGSSIGFSNLYKGYGFSVRCVQN